MHFPVLLCGIMCGPILGLICGVVTPLMSFLASGGARPPFPNGLIPMIFELAVYGAVTGLLRKVFLKNRTTNRFASVLAMIVAMVAGRLVNAAVGAVALAIEGSTTFTAFLISLGNTFANTWAGLILQITLIPALLFAMQRGGILVKYLPDTPAFSSKRGDPAQQTAADSDE